MNRNVFSLCAILLALAAFADRKVTSLSGDGWTLDGEPVSVPHTWNAVDGCDGGVNPPGTFTSCRASSYVRKAATYARALPDPAPGKRQFVKCEAVSIKAAVRVNGREVGRHRGAFTAFCFEVTDFLKPAGNRIEIVADNTLDEDIPPIVGDFTMYGGVYRDVYFIETDPVCIDLVTDGADGVIIDADPKTGEVVARVNVLGGTNETRRFSFPEPKLWSPERPAMYSLKIAINQKGSTDAVDIPFGFRSIRFDDTGFYLNGERRKFRGACRHQDREGKGWAVSREDEAEDVGMMKKMGCDAVRTAHYPQSRNFLDACDKAGLMVWIETVLVNEVTFSETFHSNMLQQTREMVAQRRNHPSIVVWGLFNEIYSGSKHKAGTIEKYLEEVRELFRAMDTSRKVVCASNQYGRKELSQVADFCAFNVYPAWYDVRPWYFRRLDRDGRMMRELLVKLRETNGLPSIGIGEYGAGGSVRRHNEPFLALPYAKRDDAEEYQVAYHYCNYRAIRDDDKVWGSFIWQMFDSGSDLQHEPGRPGCNTKGLVEFDHKTPKDAFYFYKAIWNREPMLHLTGSRRKAVTNLTTTVFGFCNAGKADFFLNGEKYGEQAPDDLAAVIWENVPLKPGKNTITLKCGKLKESMTLQAPDRVKIAADEKNPVKSFKAAAAKLSPAGGVIEFERGEYRIPESSATDMRFYISNHDQSDVHRVAFPIVGATNLTIKANGSVFVFGGKPIPFAIIDSLDVMLKGFSVDSSYAFMPELVITGFKDGKTIARMDPARHPHRVKDGRILFSGEGWEFPVHHAKLFDGETRELVERSGDIPYKGKAEELSEDTLALEYDFSKRGQGGKIGDVVVFRPPLRPCPGVFVSGSENTVLEDVAIHSSLGMALIAQRSGNVTWRGTGSPEDRKSGVFPRKATGRYASAHADASHFSNVKGQVTVENCLFEGMMDDAINVHSTCLFVTNVVAPNAIRCRYMHPQAVGFDIFLPREKLRFIDGDTLETGPEVVVAEVVRHDAREVTLTLDRPLPEGFGVGDAVENADYQCAATFRGNIVRFNRARGTLFTTPKPVLIESNLFDRVSGSAILYAGDAHYWFESGACRESVIRGNVFRNCMTSYGSHGYCNGILSFCPEVHDIARQKKRYHGNITVADNRFETFDVPLVYAYSVDGLVFRNNRVVRNSLYRGAGKPKFIFEHSENVKTDEGFQFLNVVSFSPGKEEVAAKDMIEYTEKTGNSIVLYSLTLHPEGKPAWKKVEAAVASYRRFAKALEGTDVRPAILLQAILGHWPRVDEEIEPWQRTIDADGNAVRFCPLDPGFRKYIRDVGTALAKERPALILGDDDIRAFSPKAECFCPLHTAEFNRRTGRNLTSDEFRALIRNAGLDSPEHEAFTEMQFDMVNDVCRLLREGIDSVDPSIPGGVSIPGWVWATRNAPEAAKIMAGTGPTFARLCNGQYSENTIRGDLPNNVLFSQAMVEWFGGRINSILDEADTYPQNLWSKSASAMHAKLVAGAFVGLKGCKVWYVNSRKGDYPVSRHYTDILAGHKGYYNAISLAESETVPTGVRIPCHRRFPVNTVMQVGSGAERKRPQDANGWTEIVFGRFGVPFSATLDLDKEGVYAVAGTEAVARFSDEELERLLSRKLLVDADAARSIAARGFSGLMGTAVKEGGLKFTGERDEKSGDDIGFASWFKPPVFEPARDAAVLSWLVRRPYFGAVEFTRVSPSAVKCRNRLGGTVVSVAYNMKMGVTYQYGEARQRWLWRILDELNGRPFDNISGDPQNMLVLARRHDDGREIVAAVNLNPDPLDALRFRRAQKPSAVEAMAADGEWVKTGFAWEGGMLTVPGPVRCYGDKIVRITE
ncbi:MAG: glycoside hydrolase family 2 TIM barrel-domain containing protein [Kiritimatiellae bacterium]|nr:glycoside hydrolase family 2 TIM barrel-domain containing protein [Kiritimatiellia bacterium]